MSCRHTFTAPDKSFATSKEDRPHFLQEISSSSNYKVGFVVHGAHSFLLPRLSEPACPEQVE